MDLVHQELQAMGVPEDDWMGVIGPRLRRGPRDSFARIREELAVRLRGRGLSYPAIARLLGMRSHASIIAAEHRYKARKETT